MAVKRPGPVTVASRIFISDILLSGGTRIRERTWLQPRANRACRPQAIQGQSKSFTTEGFPLSHMQNAVPLAHGCCP